MPFSSHHIETLFRAVVFNMSEPIISVSGLRGIVGQQLTPAVVMRYVSAFCTTLPQGKFVVGRDGRTSGSMYSKVAASTLMGHGMEVVDADVISTPTLGVLVREIGAVGGLQISASHNPLAYNGLKLFNHEGRVIPAEAGKKVLIAYQQSQSQWKEIESIGSYSLAADPHEPHLALVIKTVDIARIRARGFKVLLDANHGAGALLGRRLLEELGCKVKILGESPSGLFAHPPEPTAENLQGVKSMVADGSFDVGFCQDPDADRLAVIDESGHYIGEEFTAVLCMMHRLETNPGPVVTNCASSSMTEQIAKKLRVQFRRSPVGEANVVDAMKKSEAVYGGEGSGGPIDPRVGFVRDSFVGMAQILDLMACRGSKLSAIVSQLPSLVMIKDKLTIAPENIPTSFNKIELALKAPAIDRQDGLRLDWPDRWIILRASNTEPLVRLIAEAPTQSEAISLIEATKKAIEI
jgi:phosphomannomutase